MKRGVKAPRSLRLAGLGAAAAAAIAGPVMAQEYEAPADGSGGATVDSLTVTAERLNEHPYTDPEAPYKTDRSASNKLTEELLDVSKTVTVLSAEVIKDSGAQTFRDLMRVQPGVTLGTGEGGNAFGDRLFIRGFDARNDVYIDGLRDPGVGARETFAIEQIEIMKGPSSAFGGRGTTGGAISLITKQPTEIDIGDFEVTVGTDDTRRATVDVSRHLNPDFAVRFNAMVHTSGVGGRDYVFNDRWGVALAAEYKPTATLTFGADYFHLTTDELPDWGVPYDLPNNRPFQVRRENFYGVTARDFRKTFADVYTLNAEWVMNPMATLHTVVRYGQTGNAYAASAPERPNVVPGTVSANAKRRDSVSEYFAHNTDLTLRFDTGGISHTVVTGYDLSSEDVLNRQRAFTECAVLPCTGTEANPLLDLYNPDPTIPFGSETEVTNRIDIGVKNRAAYVIDTLKFTPQWEAFVGLRYDHYDVSLNQVGTTNTSREMDNEFVNWHLGVTYKPRQNGSIYLSHASSSNPPGEQLDSTGLDYGGFDPRVVTLEPARNTSTELGTKWNLMDEHLNLTAAVFRTEREKVPVLFDGVVQPVGEQRVDGFELNAAGNVTDSWSLFGGFTQLWTEITDSPVASQVGKQFPNVSETSFSLTSRHQLTERLHLGGTATYASEKFGGAIEALNTRVPDYWRLDFFGGFEVRDGVEISFNVLNATDEVYYDAIYRSATPFTYIAPGRSASIMLDIDF
ncbi:MAG TPA: TonB-dependent siderophore receptor [Caulobacteraceae bacterium]|nr:TonB-dependent siderophore receptor [Caulobacteraceae bacterium]